MHFRFSKLSVWLTMVPVWLWAPKSQRGRQRAHEGNVAFISKSQLIEHYVASLGATHVGGRLMIIDSEAALKLINRYFSNI